MCGVPNPFFRNFCSLGRKWLKRPIPERVMKGGNSNFEFTVASYNVLADILLKEHPHLYWNTQNKDSHWIHDWNYRKQNLLREITFADADILCLQEVQEEHFYEWFHPKLKEHGYTGVYKKRSGDKHDGCATFYKTNRFTIDKYQMLDFNHENIHLMDRNNVAILMFLKPCSDYDKTTICIGNTHLLFNQKRGDIKLAQVAYIFAEIDRLAESDSDSKYLPVILCGDFNSVPFSPLYYFVTKGELGYQNMNNSDISGQSSRLSEHVLKHPIFPEQLRLTGKCKWRNGVSLTGEKRQLKKTNSVEEIERPGVLVHDLTLKSSYQHQCLNGYKEVTTCHDRACVTVDYIFYSTSAYNYPSSASSLNQSYTEKMWLSGVLSLLSDQEVRSLGQLPNQYLSSDHLMLISSFILL